MRIQVLVPLIIGLSACGIGSALVYHYLKEQEKDRKGSTAKKRNSSSATENGSSSDVITSVAIAIHNEFVPVIVGKDGLSLKALQTKTRTKITFQEDKREDDHQTCTIEGTVDAIEDAKKIVLTITSKPLLVTEELSVSQSACARIVGRCGEMLQEIGRKSNAKVSVNSNENQRQVVITGTRSQVNSARAIIDEKILEDQELRKAIEESELKRERRGPLKSSSSQTSIPDSIQSSTATSVRPFNLPNAQMEVYVSAIASPSKFWLQMVGPQSTELDSLIEEMTTYYDQVENQELHQIEPVLDQIVASQFKFDNKWYRARVVAILPNEYNDDDMVLDIYFLDYGDSAYVAPHEVFQLRPDFLTLRFQAVECFLANVAPLDHRDQEARQKEERRAAGEDVDSEAVQQQQRFKWDRKAVARFEQLTHVAQWEVLLGRVVCHEEKRKGMGREGSPVPGLELFDVAQGLDVNIGQQLVAEGLAVPTVYQKGCSGGVGGGIRSTGGAMVGSTNSSRTMSPVGFTAAGIQVVVNGKANGGSCYGSPTNGNGYNHNHHHQEAICENSSNENFENAKFESRQQIQQQQTQLRQ